MMAPITPRTIRDALAAAGGVMRSLPRGCTPDEVQAARTAWAWLALVPPDVARVLEARAATGASWAALGRQFDIGPDLAQALYRRGLRLIAARLNAALAE